MAKWDWEEVEYATGCVPLYLKEWTSNRNPRSEIKRALRKIKKEQENDWKDFVLSAIQCLLYLPLTQEPIYFDRKYSREVKVESDSHTYKGSIVALFPVVEEAYRDFFWHELSQYITEKKKKTEVYFYPTGSLRLPTRPGPRAGGAEYIP